MIDYYFIKNAIDNAKSFGKCYVSVYNLFSIDEVKEYIEVFEYMGYRCSYVYAEQDLEFILRW